MITRTITPLPEGTGLSKLLAFWAEADGDLFRAGDMARERCGLLPQVAKAFQLKTAVAAGSVGGSMAALAQAGIAREFFSLLEQGTAFGQLSTLCPRVNFRERTMRENGSGAAVAFRGEGLPALSTDLLTATLNLDYFELVALIVVTREVLRHGARSEARLRKMLVNGVGRFLDAQLLDPTIAPSSTRPGSICYGASAVASSGSTGAALATDLENLILAIGSAGSTLRWIMPPKTYGVVAARLGSLGLAVTTTDLLGIPVILSAASPRQITLIDADSIVMASDDNVDIDLSTTTSVEMVDSSSQSGISGTGAALVSLFQNHLAAIKVAFGANWQHLEDYVGSPAVPSGVSYMTVTY